MRVPSASAGCRNRQCDPVMSATWHSQDWAYACRVANHHAGLTSLGATAGMGSPVWGSIGRSRALTIGGRGAINRVRAMCVGGGRMSFGAHRPPHATCMQAWAGIGSCSCRLWVNHHGNCCSMWHGV